ncbi:hypothetical protein GH808_08565 [Acetobacterium fimetarium]|uniref:Uncharacterized protein n=1 Tax=Acetobacterium fimetarium TaxID=52691 RepID=A0ABR6WV40_9FIRM|nr:hypothetical protein [Acetobacterium fimetarium]MBC3804484.1 hypothetical protein [Acetobacterium fimetarium]
MEILSITTEDLMVMDDGNYKILDNGAYIQLDDIHQYVNKLEFDINSFNQNVNIEITYNDTEKTDNMNGISTKLGYWLYICTLPIQRLL